MASWIWSSSTTTNNNDVGWWEYWTTGWGEWFASFFSKPLSPEECIVNLRMLSRQFERNISKCEKEEKAERNKLKKAIESGNIDGARIFATNVIRKKKEANNSLLLSSRLDAAASRLDAAVKMNYNLRTAMGNVVSAMKKISEATEPDQICKVMDDFESLFSEEEIRSNVIENRMSLTTTNVTPESQVSELLDSIVHEHNLQLSADIQQAISEAAMAAATASASTTIDQTLSQRRREATATDLQASAFSTSRASGTPSAPPAARMQLREQLQ